MSLRDVKYASDAIRIIKAMKADNNQPVSGYSATLLKSGMRTLFSYIERNGGDSAFSAVQTGSVKWVRENIDDVYRIVALAEEIEEKLNQDRARLFSEKLSGPIAILLSKSEKGRAEINEKVALENGLAYLLTIDPGSHIHIRDRKFFNRDPVEKMPKASFDCALHEVRLTVNFDGWGKAYIPQRGHEISGYEFELDEIIRSADKMSALIDSRTASDALADSLNTVIENAQAKYDQIVRGA